MKNNDSDQLYSCFLQHSTGHLHLKSEISSLLLSSVIVVATLCWTWWETLKTGFPLTRVIYVVYLQFSGNNDEIVDLKFLDDSERYAVVATNSMYIKVFELATWDCEILYGHTDIVLSVDVFTVGNLFVSSGKVCYLLRNPHNFVAAKFG